jgi:hypothetical protein
MNTDPLRFFEAVIDAGAILAGFCGTFLAFRIQREASYHRQPALSYCDEDAKDIYIGLTHFTSSFFILALATLCSMVFGFLIPLLALAGSSWALTQMAVVAGGLVASLILIIAYFLDELIHYRILRFNRLANDTREWGIELLIVIGALILAIVSFMAVYIGF